MQKDFPCYMFHADYPATRFEDAAELAAAQVAGNEGWFESQPEADAYPVEKAAHEAADEAARLEDLERIRLATSAAITGATPIDPVLAETLKDGNGPLISTMIESVLTGGSAELSDADLELLTDPSIK